MGLFWRLLAPKPLKKARRAAHPISLLTPRPVKTAKRTVGKAVNPVGALGDAVENQIVRSVRGSRSTSSEATTRASGAKPRPQDAGARIGDAASARIQAEREWLGRFTNRNRQLVELLGGLPELMAAVAEHDPSAPTELRRRLAKLVDYGQGVEAVPPPVSQRLRPLWTVEQRRANRIRPWTQLVAVGLDTGEIPDDRVEELQGFFDVVADDFEVITGLVDPLADAIARDAASS
ncbi:MAG TPA: hypothetical protein VHD91_01175 [Gaiellaceae bacterium]|nr:hypothetical protein [Gaiellaceae bacterium]